MLRKAQIPSVIIFFGLVVGIFIASIIILRITNEILTPFEAQIGNISESAGASVGYVHERFTTWWDVAVVSIFFISVILLFVSSFMIDIHPSFVILYIVALIILFMFGNYLLLVLDNVWFAVGTSTELDQTTMQRFIINNFNIILLVIFLLSGVIMYAKFKYFQGQGQGGNY